MLQVESLGCASRHTLALYKGRFDTEATRLSDIDTNNGWFLSKLGVIVRVPLYLIVAVSILVD